MTAPEQTASVWAEPLTENERQLALMEFNAHPDCRRWGNLVLEAYDGLAARLAAAETARREAMKALTRYYDDHVIEGDPPCPCTMCEKARRVFAAALSRADET